MVLAGGEEVGRGTPVLARGRGGRGTLVLARWREGEEEEENITFPHSSDAGGDDGTQLSLSISKEM